VEGAYICERDGSSFSGMGNSSLVEAVNEAVMSGCETHASMFNDDRSKDNGFVDGDKVRFIHRINGRFYNAEEEDNVEKLRHSDCKKLEGTPLNPIHIQKSNDDTPDCRTISPTELATLIHKNQNLSLSEKESLINLMMKYRDSVTSKLRKCTLMEYEFKLTDENPVMSYARVIPFAVIRKQICQMIKDDILEISESPYINPITVVHREE
jgi:hypothetical protein